MRIFVANWKRFVDMLLENKISSKLANRKWLSSVIDVVDSHRQAWYVKAPSVATCRCPVVDTVACDQRSKTSSSFVDVVRRCWQTLSSSVSTVRRRCRSLPWPTGVIVGHCCGEDWLLLTSRSRFPVSFSIFLLLPMADPSLGDTCSTLHTNPTVATSGSALMPGSANNFLPWTNASAMAQFSTDLRELEAINVLSDLSQVSQTQLDTQALMHELSMDSEVTFRKVLVSAGILPTRPGIDLFEETRPIDTSSDRSLQLTLITSTGLSVIASRMAPGLATSPATSTHTSDFQTLQIFWLWNLC